MKASNYSKNQYKVVNTQDSDIMNLNHTGDQKNFSQDEMNNNNNSAIIAKKSIELLKLNPSELPIIISEGSADEESKEVRPTWGHQFDFIFSLIGYAVGVGNIWRFPYLCYRNGGGAFLIPYGIMLFLCGIPLFILEVMLGQFSSRGAINVWDICPLFRGVGYGTIVITGIGCVYYNLLISLILFFLFSSFITPLPWSHCHNVWNTKDCIVLKDLSQNITSKLNLKSEQTSTYEFWHYGLLKITSGLHDLGHMNWPLFGCFVLAWIITYFCLIRGIKTTGKENVSRLSWRFWFWPLRKKVIYTFVIVYFTATFPYLMLTVLLIRSLILPGAWKGIAFFLRPKWELLKHFKVWNEAALQIFYSLGPGWSGLITMASYNKFRNPCIRDSFIVSIVNCGTSVYAGFVVFSVIGFMAHKLQLPIEHVATEGVGLAFIVYPEALLYLPIAPLWSVLFFCMLFTVGIDTIFVSLEVLYTAILDQLVSKWRKHQHYFNLITSIGLFLLGLPLVFQGGLYLFQLIDWYVALLSVMVFCLFETCTISWIYGIDNFVRDMEFMLQKPLPCITLWKVLWGVVNPLILLMMLISNIVFHVPIKYDKYVYPQWALNFGWCVSVVSLLPIPFCMLWFIYTHPKVPFLKRLKNGLKPLKNWGPLSEPYFSEYKKLMEQIESRMKNHETGHVNG